MIAKGIIKLRDVLQQMDTSAEPFSIAYVTYSKSEKKGGVIKRFSNCISTATRKKGERKEKATATAEASKSWAKNPAHFINATRNLQLLDSKQLRKLHIWLIIEFNGMKVIL